MVQPSVRASHILVKSKGEAVSLANNISKLKQFEKYARKKSDCPSSQKSGDLGWFKEGRMVKPFDQAAFNTKKDQIVGPIKSDFGYHVILVRDNRIGDDGNKEVLASHILIQTEMSPTTLSNLKKEATLFSYDAQDFGFEKAVQEHGLDISTYNRFDNTGYAVTGLGGLRSAIRFAFNGKTGEVSDILENEEYYAICRIDSVTPPGVKTFEEVRSQITRKIDKEKATNATLEEANNLLIKLSSKGIALKELIEGEEDLDGFKNESKTLLQGFTSIGRSHFLNGALLAAEPGDILGPLETNRGQAIVQLIEIEEFDSTKFETQRLQLRDLIFSRKQGELFQAWIEGLKEDADVIDNRKYYF